MRVAVLKKTSADAKKHIVFVIVVSSIFRGNRWKIVQNVWKPAMCTEIDKKSRVERSFLTKQRFLMHFWGPPGSPRASRDDPRNSRNRWFLSFMVDCAWKRRWTASGRPRESPVGASRRPQGTILRWFLDRFCTSKPNENVQKMLKKIEKYWTSATLTPQ